MPCVFFPKAELNWLLLGTIHPILEMNTPKKFPLMLLRKAQDSIT